MEIANGQLLSRVAYEDLFALVTPDLITEVNWQVKSNSLVSGVALYSDGDGSTTFRIPDLMGEFFRAATDVLTAARDPDRGAGSLEWQNHELLSHIHGMAESVTSSGALSQAAGSNAWGRNSVTFNTGGSETRPRNVPILTCIKAR